MNRVVMSWLDIPTDLVPVKDLKPGDIIRVWQFTGWRTVDSVQCGGVITVKFREGDQTSYSWSSSAWVQK